MSVVQINKRRDSSDYLGEVDLPRSKSIAARALVLRYITGDKTRLIGIPDCDDSRELTKALDELSALVPNLPERLASGSEDETFGSFNLGLGGTSLRFFTGLAASVPGLESEIDCAGPLRRRPFKPLADCLIKAGAEIRFTAVDGYAPFVVSGKRLRGGKLDVGGDISSQFASSLMLSSPTWEEGLDLHLAGDNPVSIPYLSMTAAVMRSFGISAEVDGCRIKVAPGIPEAPEEYEIEADWSAASYFYELALLSPGCRIKISSLTAPEKSLQGDSACEAIFDFLGVETVHCLDGSAILQCDVAKVATLRKSGGVLEFNLHDTPDLVPALAVGMCLAGLKFKFIDVAHLRHKESDRILSMQTELEKLGFGLESGDDWMGWTGKRVPAGEGEAIATYHDHRIAMAFAMGAVAKGYISIENPEVVDKSFSDFWNQLEKVGFNMTFFRGGKLSK